MANMLLNSEYMRHNTIKGKRADGTRKTRLILALLLLTAICQVSASAQTGSKLSMHPYFSIEKNFSGARLEYNYEFKKVDFKPVDIASAGATIKYSKFMLSAAMAAPWANGGDMGFSPYLDLSGGLDFADFSFYGGWISSLKSDDDHREYDLINPFYFGVQARYERRMLLFVDDFLYRSAVSGNDFDCSSLANTLKAFLPNRYLRPYLFMTLELWRGIDDKNSFFDNTSINIGLGLALGKSTAGRCNSLRSIGPLLTVRKPNIYLYPVEPCNVAVKIRPRGEILTSTPEYGDGWNVYAHPDGSIPGTAGFLFYEASVKIAIPSKGWCVAREEVGSFFNDILSRYGYNKREIGDFIEYWEKILNDAPYYTVYPLLNDSVNKVCPLTVKPGPDNILRLWFVFESADEYIDLPEPSIPVFKRDGFVVTEWGGILID